MRPLRSAMAAAGIVAVLAITMGEPPLTDRTAVTIVVAELPPPPVGGAAAPVDSGPPPQVPPVAPLPGPAPGSAVVPPPPPLLVPSSAAAVPARRPHVGPPLEVPSAAPAAELLAPTPDPAASAAAKRKHLLVAAITDIPDADLAPASNTGIRRTLVLMGRAGLSTAAALGTPLGMLAGAMLVVVTIGRIGIIPAFRRRRQATGTVQWFDADAGYGLILPDGSDEQVFAHISVVPRRERSRIGPGRRVTYGMMPGTARAIATRVRWAP